MYCPQCSQQQIADEMRFCSRCGFPLSAVRDLITSGGASAELPQKVERSRAMRGARQGAWIMLAGLVLTLFVGLITAIDDDFAVLLLVPTLCFLVGFVRLLYGVFVQDRAQRRKNEAISGVSSAFPQRPPSDVRNKELPASTSQPARAYIPPIKTTADVVQPPSVTENTTRLLDE